MWQVKRSIFSLYYKQNTLCCNEICYDYGWKNCMWNGDSKWVTGKDARETVQKMRKQYMGIMVGINTVLEDNPMLNCRIEENVDPIRVICDSNLRIPLK